MQETPPSNPLEQYLKIKTSSKSSTTQSSITSLLRDGEESRLKTYMILTWPREFFIVVNKTTAIPFSTVLRGIAVTFWTRQREINSSTYMERRLLSIKLPTVLRMLSISLTYGKLKKSSYVRLGLRWLASSKTK